MVPHLRCSHRLHPNTPAQGLLDAHSQTTPTHSPTDAPSDSNPRDPHTSRLTRRHTLPELLQEAHSVRLPPPPTRTHPPQRERAHTQPPSPLPGNGAVPTAGPAGGPAGWRVAAYTAAAQRGQYLPEVHVAEASAAVGPRHEATHRPCSRPPGTPAGAAAGPSTRGARRGPQAGPSRPRALLRDPASSRPSGKCSSGPRGAASRGSLQLVREPGTRRPGARAAGPPAPRPTPPPASSPGTPAPAPAPN